MGIKLRNLNKLLIHLKIIVSSLDVNLRDIMINTHGGSIRVKRQMPPYYYYNHFDLLEPKFEIHNISEI